MPNFLDAPELLPLPSLQAYTSISVLLLSCSLYHAFSVTSDAHWRANYQYGFQESIFDSAGDGGGLPEGSFPMNETTFDWEEYFESFLEHYDMSGKYKELVSNPYILRLVDVALIMLNEPLCVWTSINMCYCFLILVGKVIQKLIFGPLRASEQQLVRDKFWNFLIYKFIFVFSVINVQYMDELILWCGWFSILGFMLVLTYLCKERFNYLAFSPIVTKWAHARLLTLLVFIAISTIPLFVLGFIVGYSANFSIGIFLVSEALLLCLRTIYCIALYCVHLVDLNRETAWENRATVNYYVQLVFDLIILTIDLAHHLHMLFWSNIILSVSSLVIVIQLRSIYTEIAQRIRKHRNYLQVLKLMQEQFSVATKEDLERNNDDCAICWEPMTRARKLPCGHLFHTNCLRSWLEQDTSCPTCRNSLRQVQQDDANGEAPGHNHFFHFDGSRYSRWLPTVSVELRGQHAMDININASIGQGFRPQEQQQQHAQVQTNQQPAIDQRIFEHMTANVHEWFPQIPVQLIQRDLRITRSVELTMENIIDGRIYDNQHDFRPVDDEDDGGSANQRSIAAPQPIVTPPASVAPTTGNRVLSSTFTFPFGNFIESTLASREALSTSTSSSTSPSTSSSSTTTTIAASTPSSSSSPSSSSASLPASNDNVSTPKSSSSATIAQSMTNEEIARNFHRLSANERHSLLDVRREEMFRKAREGFLRQQQNNQDN